jgi:two-component system sensor histidine kinase UhpB
MLLVARAIAALVPILRCVLTGAALLACSVAAAQVDASAAASPPPWQVFADALAADDGGGTGFPENAPSGVVALPDDWAETRPGVTTPRWYRLRFNAPPAPSSAAPLALMIEHLCGDGRVLLNGHALHIGGSDDERIALDCERPLLVALPAPLLREGGNTVDIRLAGYALEQVASRQRAARMSAPLIGEYHTLQTKRQDGVALNAQLPQLTSSALLVMGLVLFVLGWWHQREPQLLYFGALAAAWALLIQRPWWHMAQLGRFSTEIAVVTLFALAALFGIQFLLHYARRRWRVVPGLLLLQCALVPLTMVAAGDQRVNAAASAWYAVLALEALLAIAIFLRVAGVAQRRDFRPLAALVVLGGVMIGSELAGQQMLIPPFWRALPQIGTPLVFLWLGLLLVHQYGRALRSAEELRNSLESRIRDSAAAMERNYAQMAELRVEQVTQQERKRIAADLHDDLGAKLLTIVHTSESERISTLAREALEEMRLSVRGLTGKPVKLIDALGDWRAEVVGRLSQTGVEGEWQAPSDDLPQTLSARAYVQTTRILREAVNNIIKHSGASRCSIRCTIASGDFQLKIQDNGKGIPLELDGRMDRGHGMTSMKHRAKQLQGQCLVESGPGYGTVIRLTIPLEKHTLAA